jgi:hypothetical protein
MSKNGRAMLIAAENIARLMHPLALIRDPRAIGRLNS